MSEKSPAGQPTVTGPSDVSVAPAPKWFLGFDCATKTFAFSIGYLDLDGFAAARAGLKRRLAALAELVRRGESKAGDPPDVAAAAEALAALDRETRSFIRIVDGGVRDLAPGKADRDVTIVERIRAVAAFVDERVRPAVKAAVPPGEALHVVVEFQMGANHRAREVAAALVTLFVGERLSVIGPSLKNMVAVSEEGRYCHFAEKYRCRYTANKKHALYNFQQLEAIFGTGIPKTSPPSLRGHIADSFMQLIGHLVHGKTTDGGA